MQTLETKRKDIVDFFLRKGLLVSNDLLGYLGNDNNLSEFCKLIEQGYPEDITVLSEKIKEVLGPGSQNSIG